MVEGQFVIYIIGTSLKFEYISNRNIEIYFIGKNGLNLQKTFYSSRQIPCWEIVANLKEDKKYC